MNVCQRNVQTSLRSFRKLEAIGSFVAMAHFFITDAESKNDFISRLLRKIPLGITGLVRLVLACRKIKNSASTVRVTLWH